MTRPLILLFGMPRSGTTWIGKILDSHPDTAYRHEPDAGGTLDHVPWVAGADAAPAVGVALREFAARLLDMTAPRVAASRARRGELTGLTGIDDPYEPPAHADPVLPTVDRGPEESAQAVLDLLAERGFLDPDA